MKYLVVGLILVLVILHQDVWNWDNDRLVFGFIPLTLAYHVCISIAASAVWLLAASKAWPSNLEDDNQEADNLKVSDSLGKVSSEAGQTDQPASGVSV